MIEQLKPWDSLADISNKTEAIKAHVDSGLDLAADTTVAEYFDALEHRFASSAARLMTGRRAQHEIEEFTETVDVYCDVLGTLTANRVLNIFDETGSVDKAKQAGLKLIETSKTDTVTEDFKKRLDSSSIERLKRRMAERPGERFLYPLVLSALASTATTAIIMEASEATSSIVDFSPAQGGTVVIMGGLAYRMASRSVPRQVGDLLKGKVNSSYGAYITKSTARKAEESEQVSPEDMPRQYAENHLDRPMDNIYRRMQEYVVDSREDIEPMVEEVIGEAKDLIYETYGIETYEDDRPLYRRILGRIALSSG